MSGHTFVISPMPKECVFSYIVRINMVLSPCKMPNIFGKHGCWAQSITLPHRYQEIFIKNNDSQVFSLLLESGVINLQQDILKNPVDYTRTIAHFLKGDRVQKCSSYQVKYCPKCIADFIRLYGFSYLKADWASWSSGDNCRLHREPFNIIDSGNKADALQSVQSVMIGKRSKFCKSLRDSTYYREVEVEDNYYRSEEPKQELPHLASCLKNKLKAWLLIDGHTFPQNMITAVRCANHSSLVYSMESHVFRDFVFKEAYFALHDSSYFRFHEFWKRYSELHTFYCGVIEKQGLKGVIAKLRGANCSKCRDVYCPANLTIIQPCRSFWFTFQGYKCSGEQIILDCLLRKHRSS
ncbi:hypothetical protein FCV50_22710 [Vibrio kanaloae]|uniref:Uncharacterized protein n=1 Tax=Vibrio kanaloae TaxID=170673 RepID=A0A4U1YWI6_9VIBR|nr:hypothetical protein [Vibrio kanaloae]TKF25159.1 hypothetical protein FCV50_22710 [Vibrio kanaloae]